MKPVPFILLSAVCPFLCNISVMAQKEISPNPEYRMAWVLTYHEDINSTQSIRQVVGEAREHHLNALLPIAFHLGRCYYASSFLPTYNPANADPPLDTLAEFIRFAHDTSAADLPLEIHPWLGLFPVWTEQVSPPPGHVVLTHPQWLTQKYQSGSGVPDKAWEKWLDPGVPGVCDHLVEICKEIVTCYDVDGLNLDYIRYPEGGYGYNPIALDRFKRRTKRTDIPMPEDPEWQSWQREQITNLVRRIHVETKMIKPGLRLSVCSIVRGNPDKPREKQDFYTSVMQDWPSWCQEGIVDINLPMNYRSESGKSGKNEFRAWTEFCRNHSGDRLFVNGLGNLMNTIPGSVEQVLISRSAGAGGVCFFHYARNNNEGKPPVELLNALRREAFVSFAPVPKTPWLEKPDTGIIRGFLYRSDKNRIVDGMKLTLWPSGKEVYSDGSGYYAFVRIAPGDHEIHVSKDLEIFSKRNVTVKSGEIVTVNFDLLGLVEHRL